MIKPLVLEAYLAPPYPRTPAPPKLSTNLLPPSSFLGNHSSFVLPPSS